MILRRFLPVNTYMAQSRIAFVLIPIFMCILFTKHRLSYSERPAIVSANLASASHSKYASKYNLLDRIGDGSSEPAADHPECSLDYMNVNKLAQDDPCVIDTIRRHYLHDPSPISEPYNLTDDLVEGNAGDHAELREYQSAQSPHILGLLINKTEGFFLECGATDGKFLSTTLYMERSLKWTGVLIEANPHNYQKLLARNRKAWSLPICLSIEPYPMRVSFVSVKSGIGAAKTHIVEVDVNGNRLWDKSDDPNSNLVAVQCFPLYSILLAVNRTRIDFLALDIEGHELRVLETVPWHKVDIRTMAVEWPRIPDVGEKGERLTKFLEANGYRLDRMLRAKYTADSLYFKNIVNVSGR